VAVVVAAAVVAVVAVVVMAAAGEDDDNAPLGGGPTDDGGRMGRARKGRKEGAGLLACPLKAKATSPVARPPSGTSVEDDSDIASPATGGASACAGRVTASGADHTDTGKAGSCAGAGSVAVRGAAGLPCGGASDATDRIEGTARAAGAAARSLGSIRGEWSPEAAGVATEEAGVVMEALVAGVALITSIPSTTRSAPLVLPTRTRARPGDVITGALPPRARGGEGATGEEAPPDAGGSGCGIWGKGPLPVGSRSIDPTSPTSTSAPASSSSSGGSDPRVQATEAAAGAATTVEAVAGSLVAAVPGAPAAARGAGSAGASCWAGATRRRGRDGRWVVSKTWPARDSGVGRGGEPAGATVGEVGEEAGGEDGGTAEPVVEEGQKDGRRGRRT